MGSRNLSKKTTFSFLVAALTVLKTNFWSYVSPSHLFFQFIFENHSRFCRKEQDISERSRTSIFQLALTIALRWSGSHVRNANSSANASARKWKIFHFLRRRLCLRLRLRLGSSHVYLLVLALALALAFAFASLVWTSLYYRLKIELSSFEVHNISFRNTGFFCVCGVPFNGLFAAFRVMYSWFSSHLCISIFAPF